MTDQSLRVAIVGMGGFAREHHRVVKELEEAGECRLVGACDPRWEAFEPERTALDLSRRGVRGFTSYEEMFDSCAGDLDVVTAPIPVPLHAPVHGACVQRGVACYLEKPPTLDPVELDAMLAKERGARFATQVGFNFIIEESRLALKRRLLSGEFGRLRRVAFLGLWPRPTAYFGRAPWAGRLEMGGRLVLDSCVGNAMAHFIHNLLFWAGQPELLSWEEIVEVRAELYRAHAIQGTDTVFAIGTTSGGVDVRVAASHACVGASLHRETVVCERATLHYVTGDRYSISWHDGRAETGDADRRDLLQENLLAYLRFVRGVTDRPLTRLEDAGPFVRFLGLIYVAAQQIHGVNAPYAVRAAAPGGEGENVAIEGVAAACEALLESGRFPSALGLPWGHPGGAARAGRLSELAAVVGQMSACAGGV